MMWFSWHLRKFMRLYTALAFLIASSLSFTLFAQEPALSQTPKTHEDEQTVQIKATKDPDLKSYRSMIKGLDAYEKMHDLAPTAAFKYRLVAQNDSVQITGTNMRIAGDVISIAVPIETDGSFSLPRNEQAISEDAELILNQKRHSMRWRPNIRSEGLAPNQRRLGDLRLECEIRWAVEYDDMFFLRRTLFNLEGNPCHSAMVSVIFYEDQQLKSVSLIDGEKRKLFSAKDMQYTLPLHDSTWSNDSLIEFEYGGIAKNLP